MNDTVIARQMTREARKKISKRKVQPVQQLGFDPERSERLVRDSFWLKWGTTRMTK